jgi:hypothetical protein
MTDDLALYHSDYATWLRHAAPRIAPRLAEIADDAELARCWAALSRDAQLDVWQHLDQPTQSRVRALRTAATEVPAHD